YHQREVGCLDLVSALGRAFQGTDDKDAMTRIRQWGVDLPDGSPEAEIALVRISPRTYLDEAMPEKVLGEFRFDWRYASGVAQGLGEIAALPESTKDKKQLLEKAEALLRA